MLSWIVVPGCSWHVLRADSTHAFYEFHLTNTILPAVGALRLRECTVGRVDAFLRALEPRYAANTRRKLPSIVSGVLQHAVLAESIPHNPVRDLGPIEQSNGSRKAQPRGLTVTERQQFSEWLDGSSDDEKRRKQLVAQRADLRDRVRYMLGTGFRIGEALASRPRETRASSSGPSTGNPRSPRRPRLHADVAT